MTRFPSLEGKEIIALLKDHGFVVDRQRGSHCYLKHEDGRATVLPGDTVFAVSQALSWLAKERREVQEQLEWKHQIPELIRPLLTKGR